MVSHRCALGAAGGTLLLRITMRGRFASLPEISRRRARRGVAAAAVLMLLLVSGTAKERLDQLAQGAGGRKEELPNQHASDPRNEHGTFADRRILREVA